MYCLWPTRIGRQAVSHRPLSMPLPSPTNEITFRAIVFLSYCLAIVNFPNTFWYFVIRFSYLVALDFGTCFSPNNGAARPFYAGLEIGGSFLIFGFKKYFPQLLLPNMVSLSFPFHCENVLGKMQTSL